MDFDTSPPLQTNNAADLLHRLCLIDASSVAIRALRAAQMNLAAFRTFRQSLESF
jgi:hypothetical protein